MAKGMIREYDAERGCGIIQDNSSGKNLTVYANYIQLRVGQVLNAGQAVEFDIENHRHEMWAINVKPI